MTRLTLADLPGAGHAGATRRTSSHDRKRRRRRRSARALAVLVVAVGLVGGGLYLASEPLRDLVAQITEPDDYEGQGMGEVLVRVAVGDTGRDIGKVLADNGVVKTAGAFTAEAAEDSRAASIQPGTYALREQMSGASALALLLEPESLRSYTVTIPEGYTAARALERVATATESSVEALTAAAADPAVGLPPEAEGRLEGWIFPATYEFDLDTTDVEVMRTMVERAMTALDAAGVPSDQREQVLTTASLVQAEAGGDEDMPKVSRVIANRLAQGMPLQFDTTVNYATGKGGITTTAEDRASDSPYNTYRYPGLPAGPINNPGDAAIEAAMAPAEGDWLFFVVVDPDTGETRFAATKEEHDANVELFRAWLRGNPQP